MTNTEKALKLAALGFYCFPVNGETKQPYYQKDVFENGHRDATTDPERLATWFSVDFPTAEVGIHTGASELVVLDVDVDEDKSGYDSLGFLPIPETFSYPSRSGKGRHYLYDLADSPFLAPQNRYRRMEGIDRKSGSSYVVFWGDSPDNRDALAAPPSWLLDLASDGQVHTGFTGDVDDWFASIPLGEPTETVRGIIDNLPMSDFGHQEVIGITYRLVRLAAEGHTGVDWAFDELWRRWVKPPYDSPELKKELQDAIFGAIRKAGEADDDISSLPPYGESVDAASIKLVDLLMAEPKGKTGYFKLIRACIADGLDDDDVVASLVWSAPATQVYARDWGISYLREQIAKIRADMSYEKGEGITGPTEDEDGFTSTNVVLLTDAERKSIEHEVTMIDRYVAHAATRVTRQNTPYTTMNAWTVLSCWASTLGFIPRKNGREGLNSFGMILGETTSGKSAERKLMMMYLKELFLNDPGFNIGGNPSPSALTKKLLERDDQLSFFNRDEAHGAMKTWIGADWSSGLLEDLADYYDGWVSAQLRTSDKDGTGAKGARTHFVMHLQATPDAMIALLNRDLFLSGFLARFIWALGWPREVSYESMAEEDSEGDEVRLGFDPYSRQGACELSVARRFVQEDTGELTTPVRIDTMASKRIQDAKWQLNKMFERDPNFEILQPALVRMGVMIRKAASMLVLSEGRTVIEVRDILLALKAAEEWTSSLAIVARQIVASDWQRATDEIEAFLDGLPFHEAKRERLLRKFKHVEGVRMEQMIGSLIAQGRLREYGGGTTGKMIAVVKDE